MGSVVLLQHLDMEIPFKVSMGSVVLLQHLDMEIPFKVSVGSVPLPPQQIGIPEQRLLCVRGGWGLAHHELRSI